MRRPELHRFLSLASDELSAEYRRITSRSKEDPGTAGDETEAMWKETLRGWLPDYYPIVTKGRILNQNGKSSPQIDVLVLNPAYPRRIREKKIYLTSAVVAAFECKTTLRKRDLIRFYQNCRRVKNLLGVSRGTIFRELFAPIYYGLFALSSRFSGDIISECERIDKRIIPHPREMPDALCVADREIILTAKSNLVFDKEWFEPADRAKIRELQNLKPVWTGYYPSSGRKHPFVPLGLLIQSLYYHLGWRDTHIRDMHNVFEDTGFRADTGASVRRWPYSIYSKLVQDEFKLQSKLTNGVRWSEWSVLYI